MGVPEEVDPPPEGIDVFGGVDVDDGGAVLGRPASGLLLVQAVSRVAAQRQARVRDVACLLRVVTLVTSP
jgi:hypothetical protein